MERKHLWPVIFVSSASKGDWGGLASPQYRLVPGAHSKPGLACYNRLHMDSRIQPNRSLALKSLIIGEVLLRLGAIRTTHEFDAPSRPGGA